jgi:hypothetical protein
VGLRAGGLAAEANARFTDKPLNNGWGYDGETPGFPIRVPHPKPGRSCPEGGNQLYADGSANWVKFDKMLFLTSWNTGTRRLFFYQEDIGPTLSVPFNLNQLKPQGADLN